MQSKPVSYLFEISYFGSRYKGWAPQANQRTVQRQLERVINYVLDDEDFTLIGSSRTDSGVSCRQGFFQLFLKKEIEIGAFAQRLNEFLPPDIRVKAKREVDSKFNLIQSVSSKTYRYYFSDSDQFEALEAAHVAWFQGPLDLQKMEEACLLFKGEKNFKAFCKPNPNKSDYVREIFKMDLSKTQKIESINFENPVYVLKVQGSGFLHQQIRKIVTAIVRMGNRSWESKDITQRLDKPDMTWEAIPPAPANGLILWETNVDIPDS
ncbi:tRNA pseudouridine(38-40) synthase TruA [Algoriphagus sediminis]|uniref:tRNA pseudouridine synthase A n=1 Tax=Algoriphagus sediminis TaxID=3057113 RepID=A0ABT7YF60_9BACT|nr:tRNA pseudouridine(38-40) synthase TruA [Algoriphagus sediminis]MDN3205159.1 tRNA pseudouridine(38-40) synthase TruA [Algoriphagus sediminis]